MLHTQNADDEVLELKQAIPLSKIGRSLFLKVMGKPGGPPIKRVGRRVLVPAEAFRTWLRTPTKPRKGK